MAIFIGDPSGLTWEGARAKVRGDLWRPGNSLSDDVVNRALHASVLELEAETTWLWLENISTIFTIEEPAAYVDLPPAIGRVGALALKRGVQLDPLIPSTLAAVRADADRSHGTPGRFALGDQRIWFDAMAPADAEFEIIFTAQTPELLERAVDVPSITMQRQQQAVIANACYYVAGGFMKNEAEAARQRTIYETVLQRLHNNEAQARGGCIQPDTWGMGCA